MPGAKIVSANPVVRGCRMIKTPAELALMQLATDVTIAAYRWTYKRVEKGMGLERVAAVMQGVHDNYDTDTFKALIAASEALTQGRNSA